MTIVLSTLNARYSHTSLGLRYLLANMGELQSQTQIQEQVPVLLRTTQLLPLLLVDQHFLQTEVLTPTLHGRQMLSSSK